MDYRMRRRMMLQSGGGSLVENFVRVGNPTIEDGIMTASSSAWITTPESFNPGSNPWSLTVKIYRQAVLGTYEGIIGSDGLRLRTPYQSNNVVLDLYSDSGTIASGSVNKSVAPGAWRWLRVIFSGSSTGYDYGISTDGVTYKYIGGNSTPHTGYIPSAYKKATPIKAGILNIGHDAGNYYTTAKFDLMETKIEVNGVVWWTPYVRG